MTDSIKSHQLPNGLVLVGEPTDALESAAFNLLIPAGCQHDPPSRAGLASITCEMMLRGAGKRDSRALVNDLDNFGIERSESVGVTQAVFSGCSVAEQLPDALRIYADIVRRPHLPGEQLEAGRQVCLQEIWGNEDEPSQKLMNELRRQQYPSPFGLASQGTEADLQLVTIEQIAEFHQQRYSPEEAILAVAGRFDWDKLCQLTEELFGDWESPADVPPVPAPVVEPVTHLPYDSSQCHIGVAFESIPYRDPDYFQAWAAVGVLSGGMSSRLFTEVREKRGLCYTVSASLHTQRERAAVFAYAGTTSERAQETLDVMVAELVKLGDGVKQRELDRLKARIKSSLIMQQESSNSRSGSLARDWRHLGRARTLDELATIVDGITADSINAYLEKNPPGNFKIVTLGPEPLTSPV